MNKLTQFAISLGLAFTALSPAMASEPAKPSILAIFAHPDDEVTVGPLLARYAREGHDVYLAVVTDGQHGVAEHAGIAAGDALKQARLAETQCATKALGINPPIMLEFVDGSLAQWQNLEPLDTRIAKLFAEVKPNVVITWGPEGGYGHPDHRMVSNLVAQVYQKATEHSPDALYFAAASALELHKYSSGESAYGQLIKNIWHTSEDKWLTHKVAFTKADMQRAAKAIACHKSQFTPADIQAISRFVEGASRHIYLRQSHIEQSQKQGLFE
ncbi:PIG-L family deacetylase [Bowmanella sp. Y26]|uniref:PIG-L deacetylase family protein n=1 Tax=Bowmanella yangjiangensis TaxID=2811230 RepID=UPI001BDC2228|nr:PIG-L family deacetylase [Bowmanella yangjiangensis]MBT1062767.1 PIG-L family deacetylase [Bowmanella yangjiangensis]